jgi:hypothetical protein
MAALWKFSFAFTLTNEPLEFGTAGAMFIVSVSFFVSYVFHVNACMLVY